MVSYFSGATKYSYDTLAISRPELYNFLVDQIPEEKLILGKQVQELVFQGIAQEESSAPSLPGSEPRSMSISGHAHRVTPADAEKNGSVMTTDPSLVNERVPSRGTERSFIVCTDGTRYDGIIIGADGAYSVTRRHLYKHLREKGLLTESSLKDEENKQNRMQAQFRVLVGMTRELDPDRFELVKNVSSDVRVLVSQGDKPFMFWCVPVTGNRICWMLDELLPESFTCPDVEDFTQDQDVIQKLCESVRSIPSPCGKGISVGEIIEDLTPSGTAMLLSREEGYFSPRTHDNVALMGDYPTAIDSFETAAREVNRRGTSRIEDRLRSYDVERRAEAEHAVKQAGRFARLLLQKTLDVRSGVDGSRERDEEMRDGELQRLLQELQ
ncbi:hypothetical protein FBU30_008876 [Linnemannia zychae]|nr:hypothetical protein FBU30_008876 [Linnemannia zychae]